MKTGQELYKEHADRIKRNIAMEKTDRPAVLFNGEAFLVQYMGGKLSDLVNDTVYGHELWLKGMLAIGDIDCSIEAAKYPNLKGFFSLAKMRLPGRELSDNMIWQVEELNPMTVEDYDTVIDKGWSYYAGEFQKKYLSEVYADLEYWAKVSPGITQRFSDAGIVYLCTPAVAGEPFGALSSARGISNFLKDLIKIPDKVLAAMDVMHEEQVARLLKQVKDTDPFSVFTGGAREAGDFISRKTFEKFAWPYKKRNFDLISELGKYGYLHLDSSWDRFIDYFKETEKGKFIFHPDSTTDIFKAGEVLKGHMCFAGDVSPSLMTIGTPEEVYAYSMRLVEEFSSQGFIMAAGCGVPSNAKPENVKAMLAAVFGK